MEKQFDVIIIGGGPAGLTAAIYATRSNLSTLVIENKMAGGQVLLTNEIDNYPGFEKIPGFDLGQKFADHAKACGAEIVLDEISQIDFRNALKTISTEGSGKFVARSVIVCTGAKPRKLGNKDEDKFEGRGLSYCSTCDGAFFKGKTVAVVGGGNAAVEEALHLANIAKTVHLVHMLPDFQAFAKLVSILKSKKNVKIHLETTVEEIVGDNGGLSKIICTQKNKKIEFDVQGLFVSIGRIPNTSMLIGKVKLDEHGYVLCDENLETNEKGVFVAGDCRQKEFRQIITACADGAIAADSVMKFFAGSTVQE